MRVIAGSRKRLQLQTVPGMNTRPTTDRIKETLFNMISTDIYDARFLDLFAGSGQMGIEALSRGATHAYFLEKDRKAISCIQSNLEHTKFLAESRVVAGDVLQGLKQLQGESFDIIFMDPPYHLGIEQKVLEAISSLHLLAEDGYIIIEADIHTDFSYIEDMGYTVLQEKQYKTNKHLFITKEA